MPASSPGLQISYAEFGLGSNENFGTSSQPFQAGSINFPVDETGNTTFLTITGNLQVNKIDGAGHAQISVETGAQLGVNDITSAHIMIDGSSPAGGSVIVDHKIDDTSFNFTGGGTLQELVLNHPQIGFISNSLVFSVSPIPNVTSAVQRVVIGDLTFDSASFLPDVPGGFHGTLSLLDGGRVVASDNNVIASGFGTFGGAFSVGIDPVSHHDYVQFSKAV